MILNHFQRNVSRISRNLLSKRYSLNQTNITIKYNYQYLTPLSQKNCIKYWFTAVQTIHSKNTHYFINMLENNISTFKRQKGKNQSLLKLLDILKTKYIKLNDQTKVFQQIKAIKNIIAEQHGQKSYFYLLILNQEGQGHMHFGNHDKALNIFKQCLAQSMPNHYFNVVILKNIIELHKRMNRQQELKKYQQEYSINKQKVNKSTVNIFQTVSHDYQLIQMISSSMRYLEFLIEQIEKSTTTNKKSLIALSEKLGNYFFKQEQYIQSQTHFNRSLQLYQQYSIPMNKSYLETIIKIGQILIYQRKYQQFITLHIKHFNKIQLEFKENQLMYINFLKCIGIAFYQLGQYQQSQMYLSRVISLSSKYNYSMNSCSIIAQVYQAKFMSNKQALNKYLKLDERLLRQSALDNIQNSIDSKYQIFKIQNQLNLTILDLKNKLKS